MRSIRIWFSKTGTAKYISHLDLTRCLIRAFRRTDIPLWYTEGYNPHPHLVFGLSLPLGAEGLCESLDIRLDDENYTNEKVLFELKRTGVPGIDFISVTKPVNKPLAITFGLYDMVIPTDNNSEEIKNIINTKLSGGSVNIEKKTKKKEIKTINVCDYITDTEFKTADGSLIFSFKLPAGNDFTVNPISFCNSLFENTYIDSHSCLIRRKKLLLKDGSDFK